MMIIFFKKRPFPVRTMIEERLSKRLLPRHPLQQTLAFEISKGKAGYKGEKNVDYYLDFLPGDKFRIIPDLRLQRKKYFYQIDSLLICQYFLLPLEIKNVRGILRFDRNLDQLIQVYKGEKKRITNPIHQAKRHRTQLRQWLTLHQFPLIPIEYFFVNSNDETIIEIPDDLTEVVKKICNSEVLLEKIYKLEREYVEPKLTNKELNKLTKQLLKEDTPLEFNVKKYYSYNELDLIKGVFCPACSTTIMDWKNRAWECPDCHLRSHTAHIDALLDHHYLISPFITNLQCREFLRLESSDTVRHHLITLGLEKQGSNRNRTYNLASLINQYNKFGLHR